LVHSKSALATPHPGFRRTLSPVLFPYTTLFRSLTRLAARWNPPFFPASVMLLYVAAVVVEAVCSVNVDCTVPLEGTVTVCGDHRSVAHTTGLQSRDNIVGSLLLDKKLLANVTT